MPVEFGIWRIEGEKTTPVTASALANEAMLEAILERDPSILGLDVLLVLGRQVITTFGKRLDLLCMDSETTLYMIRGRDELGFARDNQNDPQPKGKLVPCPSGTCSEPTTEGHDFYDLLHCIQRYLRGQTPQGCRL